MAFGEENDPPAWTVEVSTFASSLAKQAKEKASSLVDEAVAFASEAVTVKTRDELALRPGQHHIALARQHRDMGVRSTQLEELVVEKRRELEESLVRIEELQARRGAIGCSALMQFMTKNTPWTHPGHPNPLQAAIAHRQYILAHPVVRPALPEPAVEDRRRAAAAALYNSITNTGDARAQEQAAAPGEEGLGLYDEDAYYEDAYYDEVVYGYDEANPCNDAEVPRIRNAMLVPLPKATPEPVHRCTRAHLCRPRPRARR
jgi:hypothetical protein